MGTRSITKVKDFDGSVIVKIYKQYDGYQSGAGEELRAFLSGKALVNGFSNVESVDFNGMGCLAASLISSMKKRIGGLYLYAPDSRDDYIDFNYTIYPSSDCINSSRIKIKVESGDELLFDGFIDDYEAKDKEYDD